MSDYYQVMHKTSSLYTDKGIIQLENGGYSMKTHNQWASRMGFILATAGAAIGLGNLWKFPYLMGRNGGFPFLVAYLVFICILGLPVMITEMSIGRRTGHNPVLAYSAIHPHAKIVGYFGVLAAFFILS